MIFRCPQCNKEFQAHHSGLVMCPLCNTQVKVKVLPTEGTAWDIEKQGRWLDAFIAVIKMSIADPIRHFEGVAAGCGWLRPWIFALIISAIVFLIAAAYQLGFQMLAASTEFAAEFASPFALMSVPFSVFFLIMFAIVGVPVGTTLALLVQAGIYHLCLMLLGAVRRDFMSTFRVVCYAVGPQLFQIIPLLGGMVAWVWQVVLTVIGIKVVHKTTYSRSAVAVLLPMLICCGIIMLIGMAVAGAIFAAALSAAQ
ncbi:MAG: YIP1 family protein [Pseudomonadota bacterium]